MRFSICLALSAISLVAAQNPNPFTYPVADSQITAGEPVTIKWTPTTGGTVALLLRSGSANDLIPGVTITKNLTNSGSYIWTPQVDITQGSDYTLEIISDQDSTETNYSAFFVIDSTNTIASITNPVSSATMPMTASGSMTSMATSSIQTSVSASSTSSSPSTLNGGFTPTPAASSSASTHINTADVKSIQSGLGFIAALAALVAML